MKYVKQIFALLTGRFQPMEWHIRKIAIVFFIGVALTVVLTINSLIGLLALSRIWLASSVLFYLMPIAWRPAIYNTYSELRICDALFAKGAFFTGLFLLLNVSFPCSVDSQMFEIKQLKYNSYEHEVLVDFEIDGVEPWFEARKIKVNSLTQYPKAVQFTVSEGLFGIKSISNGCLIFSE